MNGKETFKIDTFYVLMDTAVVSTEMRYGNNLSLSADISIFRPINFPKIKSNGIPNQSLSYISAKVIKFNLGDLDTPDIEDNIVAEAEYNNTNSQQRVCKNCVQCCVFPILKYNM